MYDEAWQLATTGKDRAVYLGKATAVLVGAISGAFAATFWVAAEG